MRTTTRLQRISELLALMANEIETLQTISYTDHNRSIQAVLCRIFEIVFDLSNLRNLDTAKAINHPAIDLADDVAGVAFQITGDRSGSKIKQTIELFAKHDFQSRYRKLYFYILTNRSERYKLKLRLPEGMQFSFKENVLDRHGLFKHIQKLSPEKQELILKELEAEYGITSIARFELTREEVQRIQEVFVPPAQFPNAIKILGDRGALILSGPPHVGKTTTAVAALVDASSNGESRRIVKIDADQLLSDFKSIENCSILVDDAFGEVQFDRPAAANYIGQLLDLGRKNKIVLTTRSAVLGRARSSSKLGERSDLAKLTVELTQEGSYDDEALKSIYLKTLAQRTSSDDPPTLSQKAIDRLKGAAGYVTHLLRFPHNIDRFIYGFQESEDGSIHLDHYVFLSKDIARAAGIWFENLNPLERLRVALTALCPQAQGKQLLSAKVILGLIDLREDQLIRASGGFLKSRDSMEIGHPSYREGILPVLRESLLDEASQVLRAVAESLSSYTVETISPILFSVNSVSKHKYGFEPTLVSAEIDPNQYYRRYITAYNAVIEGDFPNLRSYFDPRYDGPGRIHLFRNDDGSVGAWSIIPKFESTELVTESQEMPDFDGIKTTIEQELQNHHWPEFGYSQGSEHTSEIPEVQALDKILDQWDRRIKRIKMLPFGQLLTRATIELGLVSTDFPFDEVSDANPLTGKWIREWFAPYLEWPPAIRTDTHSRKRLTIKPHLGTVNELPIGWAAEAVDSLAVEGLSITGHLLTQRDQPWDQAIHAFRSQYLDQWYSDKQLSLAVENGLKLHYTALRQSLEFSMPRIAPHLPIVNMFPLSIVAVLDREPREFLQPSSVFYVLRQPGTSDVEPEVSVEVHIISPFNSEEQNEEAKNMREVLAKSGSFGGAAISDIIDLEDWTERIISSTESSLRDYLRQEEFELFEA